MQIQDLWQQSGPAYNRLQLGCGIAHIGVGNFVRSHLAVFVDSYLRRYPGNWMIHGMSMREADLPLIEAMQRQDFLYTLTERSGTHDHMRVIGSLKEISYAPAHMPQMLDLLASNMIKIISLTITEKGYYYDSAGNLDLAHPDIIADLHGGIPKTVFGLLFQMASQRMAQHAAPVTLLSCDNLPGNGHLLRQLLVQFAERVDTDVARWIQAKTACPNSMVDRITPTVTQASRDYVQAQFDVDDACPVISEAFLQWVLEDRFINGRPALETSAVPIRLESQSVAVSAQFVEHAEPYEKLKMRLLNGSHSALAYSSYLMGFRLVDQAMADTTIRRFVQAYMDEVTPALPPMPGIDLSVYKAMLIERFSNPAIRDQVQRLAEDGSKKICNFVVPALELLLAEQYPIDTIALALAAWFRYLRGIDQQGQPIMILDPAGAEIITRAQRQPQDIAALLAVSHVFGERLGSDQRLRAAVQAALDTIERQGMRQAVEEVLRYNNTIRT